MRKIVHFQTILYTSPRCQYRGKHISIVVWSLVTYLVTHRAARTAEILDWFTFASQRGHLYYDSCPDQHRSSGPRLQPNLSTASSSSLDERSLPITDLSTQPRRQSQDDRILPAPPTHPLTSEASSSGPPSPKPPPFSSLYFPTADEVDRFKFAVTEAINEHILATAPAPSFEEALAEEEEDQRVAATKPAVPRDTKGESSGRNLEDGEPPPPYTEGTSPIEAFTYVMAAAGGPSSIITQVSQSAGPPINTLGGEFRDCRSNMKLTL